MQLFGGDRRLEVSPRLDYKAVIASVDLRLSQHARDVALFGDQYSMRPPAQSFGGGSRVNNPLRLGSDRFFKHFL